MKKIKIFLASSIDELSDDRTRIGDYFGQLNNIYVDSGVFFSLIKCEDYDKAVSLDGKQSEYDREIEDSDLCFFLFFHKVGDYTRHEFEIAMESYRQRHRPKVVTYFKYVNSIDEAEGDVLGFMRMLDGEMHHYYNVYGHVDTLKLGMLMQIKLMKLDNSEIKLCDGEVQVNGHGLIKTENVPLLSGNESLRNLTQKKRELQERVRKLREIYFADPSEENEIAFSDARSELNRVSEQLTQVERDTLAFVTTISEMGEDGKVLTHRQKQALKFFGAGDYRRAREILEDEERRNELARAEIRGEVSKNEIQGYVEEDRLWIKARLAQGLDAEGVRQIRARYETAVELTEKHDLQRDVLYDYASFLYEQNDFERAIRIAEILRWHWERPDHRADELNRAMLLNLLGILYNGSQRYEESMQAFLASRELYERMIAREETPLQTLEIDLASSYSNLGTLYTRLHRYADAEEVNLRALEIRKRLCENEPAYEPFLAMSYNNIAVLYVDTQRYAEGEQAHLEALKLRERLASRDPENYEGVLAMSYNNLGYLYDEVGRYADAEKAYCTALNIQKRLAAQNPDAHEPDLAMSYNNLAILYCTLKRYDESEKSYLASMEIYQRLSRRDPAAFEPDLADCYNNIGTLYREAGRPEDAERVHLSGLAIYERLCKLHPEAFSSFVAMSSDNLGSVYRDMHRFADAEPAHLKALEIYKRLCESNPAAYTLDLANTYNNLGILYCDDSRYRDAERAFLFAKNLYGDLNEKDPVSFGIYFARACSNLGLLYYDDLDQDAEAKAFFLLSIDAYRALEKTNPELYAMNEERLRGLEDIVVKISEKPKYPKEQDSSKPSVQTTGYSNTSESSCQNEEKSTKKGFFAALRARFGRK